MFHACCGILVVAKIGSDSVPLRIKFFASAIHRSVWRLGVLLMTTGFGSVIIFSPTNPGSGSLPKNKRQAYLFMLKIAQSGPGCGC